MASRISLRSLEAFSVCVVLCWQVSDGTAQQRRRMETDDPAAVLSSEEWAKVDKSVGRALDFLASQQQRNGSFQTHPVGQPGITSLCVLAYLSHGHVPGEGPYGERLSKAVEFILSCQKPNGLLALVGPMGVLNSPPNIDHEVGSSASYDHALSALALSEVYSMGSSVKLEETSQAIEKAIRVTLQMQKWAKDRQADRGGWRYVENFNHEDSDLSVTGWHLMFLRSAKNAGFEVPAEPIAEAVEYIKRCYRPRHQTFLMLADDDTHLSRGMAGAGVLAFAHAGYHDSPESEAAGRWILQEGFPIYNESRPYQTAYHDDRFHYGMFLCSQATYQLGGDYWRKFYPPLVKLLLENQAVDGGWAPENHEHDVMFGRCYSTALVAMALATPNQLLPIFQR